MLLKANKIILKSLKQYVNENMHEYNCLTFFCFNVYLDTIET